MKTSTPTPDITRHIFTAKKLRSTGKQIISQIELNNWRSTMHLISALTHPLFRVLLWSEPSGDIHQLLMPVKYNVQVL